MSATSFTFTVADDVKTVALEVAKYKANASVLKVNGTEYTLSTSSNDGEYETISVDTSVNKTVTVETTSGGKRAMINTITFYGESVIDTPVLPPVDSDSTGNSSSVDPEIPDNSSTGGSSNNDSTSTDTSNSGQPEGDTGSAENSGCSGVISVGAVGLVGALTAAFKPSIVNHQSSVFV